MKLHRILVEPVIAAISSIFVEQRHADKVIETALKSNKKWGARDRAFIAETVYEMVRWWRLLREVAGEQSFKPKMLNEKLFWEMFGTWQILQGETLPDWAEFKDLDPSKILERHKALQDVRKIRESIPDWIDELGERELGKNWSTELAALNKMAPVVLRANTLKTQPGLLKGLLEKDGIETDLVAHVPEALVLRKRKNVFTSEHFKEGFFEVQDAGSQAISRFLDVKPGMRVIDACAGAGGKSLHLSAMMQNKGQLIAMDVEEWKLEVLRKRAKRNGAQNIVTRLIENSKTIKRLVNGCDRLLLDVPCSGLGVLRRNPDTKWKLEPEFLDKIRETQEEIINSYSKMLRVGGKMVYATCSILPSESEDQVRKFLKTQGKNFRLLEEKRFSPAKDGFDGFYMACLERIE
jgi:16S rRNA (cytosine967-C5)-methyltransferase